MLKGPNALTYLKLVGGLGHAIFTRLKILNIRIFSESFCLILVNLPKGVDSCHAL